MDILLIDPPYLSLKGVPNDKGYNVGLTTIAAYLRQEGVESAILMGELLMDLPPVSMWLSTDQTRNAAGQRKFEAVVGDKTHIIWKKMADIVRRTNPKAVGISYLTPQKCVVERIVELVRETNPEIKVIVGSAHPTFCPEEVMQNQDIDFVVRGEGEIPLLRLTKELMKDKPNWETVPAIHYRDNDGQVQNNPITDMITNLDELPFPARDLVLDCNYDRYRAHSLSTARGCPYTCSFCSDRRLWGGKVRRRSVDNVIEELRLINDAYNVDYVVIVDGTFTYDKKYLKTFCNTMIDLKLDLKWRCTARYDNLDEDLLQLMKKANCTGLYIGLESGSDRILKSVHKKITVEKIIKVSKMVYASKIPTVTSVLLGLPNENKEDLKDTLRLMKKIKTDIFDVNSYVPLPGTPLYDSMTEEDRNNIDWRTVSYKTFYNNFSSDISHDEFEKYKSKAYKIANNVQQNTIFRFGARIFLQSIAKKFKGKRS